jgi:hypothetical protein
MVFRFGCSRHRFRLCDSRRILGLLKDLTLTT